MLYILLFFIGSILYSFSYCTGYRTVYHLNFIYDHSRCENCHHILHLYDLIPVISFIFLKGKCRYCHKKINSTHLYIELSGGIILILLYIKYGLLLTGLYFIYSMILLICAYIDYKEMVMYDVCQFLLMLISIIKFILFKGSLMYIFIISVPLFVIYVFKKNSIGIADVIIYMSLGMLLGYKVIISFIITIYVSLLVCIYLILSKKLSKKNAIPFIPFIYIGYILCLCI